MGGLLHGGTRGGNLGQHEIPFIAGISPYKAEGVGFEPTRGLTTSNGFRDRPRTRPFSLQIAVF